VPGHNALFTRKHAAIFYIISSVSSQFSRWSFFTGLAWPSLPPPLSFFAAFLLTLVVAVCS